MTHCNTKCSGLYVCIITVPSFFPRPLRPETCSSNWKVRSLARKSGIFKLISAFKTPTKVTFSKSNPLAIICVPNKILPSLRANWSKSFWCPSFCFVVSTSYRITLAPLKLVSSCSSTFWVPVPTNFNCSPEQCGQIFGISIWCSQ